MLTVSRVNRSVLEMIGDTPLVDVSELSPNPDVRILAKLESQNPFGSVKDRIAKLMIEDAERHGRLSPGQTIVEPSSGNTGIALAAIARVKGYPVKILLPDNVSVERRQMLGVFGAEIILTPGAEGSNGAVRRAELLAVEHPEWCLLYQYGNDANPRAHYEGTGPEIWRDCPEITHFVAGLGTSGTLMGTGRYLKERNPDIKIIAIEPPQGERVEGPPQPRRRLHPAGVRAVGRGAAARPQAGGAAAGVDRVDPAVGGDRRLRRTVGGRRARRCRRRWRARSRPVRPRRSCSSSRTAGGSTFLRVPTPTISTPPRQRPNARFTSDAAARRSTG